MKTHDIFEAYLVLTFLKRENFKGLYLLKEDWDFIGEETLCLSSENELIQAANR